MRNTTHFALALLLCACGKKEPAADSTNAAPAASTTASKVGETTGLNVPESVKYDAELDVYFVSNINGNPSQKDNNGYIARIHADSTGTMTKPTDVVLAFLYLGGSQGTPYNEDSNFLNVSTRRAHHGYT